MTVARPRLSATMDRPEALRMLAGAVCLGLLMGLCAPADRALAQDAWSPIVVTSPGGTLNAPDDPPLPRATVTIDPSFFPPGRVPARTAPKVLPQGIWSPIVTGGISKAPAAPPSSLAAPAAAPASPVRPAAPAAAQPAADREAPATGSAAEPEKPGPGGAAESKGSAAGESNPAGSFFDKPRPLEALPPNATAAQQYCFNSSETAEDARFAWQSKKIKDMEAELDQRIQRLHAKTEEYKSWLERRDAFSRKAHEKLVGFYSRMRPDAAAVQLATIDENVAAAVMTKLETKVASAIMGEMDPERAAKIATIISGAAKVPGPKRQAPVAEAATPQAGQDAATPPATAEEPRT